MTVTLAICSAVCFIVGLGLIDSQQKADLTRTVDRFPWWTVGFGTAGWIFLILAYYSYSK